MERIWAYFFVNNEDNDDSNDDSDDNNDDSNDDNDSDVIQGVFYTGPPPKS